MRGGGVENLYQDPGTRSDGSGGGGRTGGRDWDLEWGGLPQELYLSATVGPRLSVPAWTSPLFQQ